MMKLLLGCATAILLATAASAQEADLFPELKGRFQPAPTEKTTPTEETVETKTTSDNGLIVVDFGASTPKPKVLDSSSSRSTDALQSGAVDPEDVTGPAGEGNIVIRLENVEGTLALARNYSFCFADAVLTNDTNLTLEALNMELIYRGVPNTLSYSNVQKKNSKSKNGKPLNVQTQKVMMIGPECEDILSAPEINISRCKLGKQPEDACKKRVQFTPPNS